MTFSLVMLLKSRGVGDMVGDFDMAFVGVPAWVIKGDGGGWRDVLVFDGMKNDVVSTVTDGIMLSEFGIANIFATD